MKSEYLVETYEGVSRDEFSYICCVNKKLFRVDKEEKTILPIVGISFQSKVILPQEILINYSSF